MQTPPAPDDLTRMRKDLNGPLTPPVWPEGVTLVPFDAQRHRAQAHALLVRAYRFGGGHLARQDDWWRALRKDPQYDPAVFFIAEGGKDRVVGLAHCWSVPFVKDLAVAEDFRRRGLGEALLRQAFLAFQFRGAAFIDLKVHNSNPSGAQRLYLRVGMVPHPL